MKSYLDKQRQFWGIDPITSKFGTVDTVSADEIEYARMAGRNFERICSKVELSDSSTWQHIAIRNIISLRLWCHMSTVCKTSQLVSQ
jgi:hypothetical protein